MGSTSKHPASSSHLQPGQERGPAAGAAECWGGFVFVCFGLVCFFPCIAEGVCLGCVYLGWKRKLAGSMMHRQRVPA